jgi:pyruvate dehydrogenase E1 component beta subunit
MHYMSNGQVNVPMVLRLPVGATRRGAQHAQSTEAYWMHTPGLKVVCPSNPYDAKGLLYAAIKDENPVIFLEHKLLYGGKGGRKEKSSIDPIKEVPTSAYEVQLGTLNEVRDGQDVTILANMMMVYRSLAAAELLAEEGISTQVIDMRCLVPLDMELLVESVKKTNRVLIVEEDNLTGGWGAEIAARLGDEVFYYLDAPIKRLAAPDTPAPTSASLEEEYLPSTDRIVEAVQALMGGG